MKITKEIWKNKEGDREDHYFLGKDRKTYLFGINPKVIRKNPHFIFDIIRLILKTVDKM